VLTERGSEFERRATFDLEELIYWISSDAAFELACQYELKNRVSGQDFRRMMFAKHIELMSIVKPEWGARKAREYEAVLAQSPYHDDSKT
jgi:Immunity protein 63